MNQDKCNCEEMSCTKDCGKSHTHKVFWCEKCHPERYDNQDKLREKEKFISKIFGLFHQPLVGGVPYEIVETEVDRFLSERDSLDEKKIRAEAEFDVERKYEKALGAMLFMHVGDGGELNISDADLMQDLVVFQKRDERTNNWKFKVMKNTKL